MGKMSTTRKWDTGTDESEVENQRRWIIGKRTYISKLRGGNR